MSNTNKKTQIQIQNKQVEKVKELPFFISHPIGCKRVCNNRLFTVVAHVFGKTTELVNQYVWPAIILFNGNMEDMYYTMSDLRDAEIVDGQIPEHFMMVIGDDNEIISPTVLVSESIGCCTVIKEKNLENVVMLKFTSSDESYLDAVVIHNYDLDWLIIQEEFDDVYVNEKWTRILENADLHENGIRVFSNEEDTLFVFSDDGGGFSPFLSLYSTKKEIESVYNKMYKTLAWNNEFEIQNFNDIVSSLAENRNDD